MNDRGTTSTSPVTVNPMAHQRHAAGRFGRAAALTSVIALTALAPACKGSGSTLTVKVDVPEGLAPEIFVNGPGNYTATIHGTTTLEDVPPGEYSVRLIDRRMRLPHPVIDSVVTGTVAGSPAHLDADAAATVDVHFEKEPGSGRVWVPIAGEDRVISLAADELTANSAPALSIDMPARSAPVAAAFDARGNLWVSLDGADMVGRIDASALGQGGAPAFAVTIPADKPQGIAFAEGDLFVASATKKQIVRWSKVLESKPLRRSEIALGGTPRGTAFDAKGNLFVTTVEPAALVVFSAESLGAPSPKPIKEIGGPLSMLTKPGDMAFDASGALWVTNGTRGEAIRFDADALAAVIGTLDVPPSAVVRRPANAAFDGLAFDNVGEGWFCAFGSDRHALAKGVEMQSPSPAIAQERDLFVKGARATGLLASPAFDPPSRLLPIRR